MFGLTHKFKLGQTQKLMAAALMLAVSPAWGEIKRVYLTGSPEKIAEEIAFCQQLHDTIEQTPDFWERFEREGFYYILTASPFKHRRVEKIHPIVVLTAGLHNYLREKQHFMLHFLKNMDNEWSLLSLAEGVKLSKQYFYQEGLDEYDFDWGQEYIEAFGGIYINHYSKNCTYDCYDQLGNDFFAYRIKSNFYNRWDIDEYTIGIISRGGRRSEYHVVDKYMQPYTPKKLVKFRFYNLPAGLPHSTMAGQWYRKHVPIYVNGRSYKADIRELQSLGGQYSFQFLVTKMHHSYDVIRSLCLFEFPKNF